MGLLLEKELERTGGHRKKGYGEIIMPSGFTEKIAKGITFEEFAMICARGMGACISMRDDPLDKPIPDEFKPSPYYKEHIAKHEKELVALEKMSRAKADLKAEEEYEKEVESRDEIFREKTDLKKKYDKMLVKVKAWKPPTPDHRELKEFMIRQIEGSIGFDTWSDEELDRYYPVPVRLSGEQWKDKTRNKIMHDINYYKKEYREDCERVAYRNKWIKELRESLKPQA